MATSTGTPDSTNGGASSLEDQIGALYGQAESQTAKALEQLVARPSFGQLLALGAENIAALTRISSDVADLILRNLRVAGRADITRLAQQLHRTEDKLERVLQEVEQLRDESTRPQRLAAGDGAEVER
jgi:CRP-like cAMP-binding protein